MRLFHPLTLVFALISLALYPSSMGDMGDSTKNYKTCSDLGKKKFISSTSSSKNPTGDRLASFVYHIKMGNFFDDVEVKLNKSFVQCGETKYLQIAGLIQDHEKESAASTSTRTPLRFHPTLTTKYVVFLNNYTTALKKDPKNVPGYGYGAVVTDRCLEDDEMFQVRLDESIPESRTNNLGIGVLKSLPSDVSLWLHVRDKQGQWSLYSNEILTDSGKIIKTNYPFSTANLPDGTLLGVMRKSNGDLHFFQNGKDGGVAATGVPKCVYGFFDILNYSKKISIVK